MGIGKVTAQQAWCVLSARQCSIPGPDLGCFCARALACARAQLFGDLLSCATMTATLDL